MKLVCNKSETGRNWKSAFMHLTRGCRWLSLPALFVLCALPMWTLNGSSANQFQPGNAGEPKTHKFDLVIYGATPGGVAYAVRAAREGLNVQLVSHTDHLGGILSNGLSTMDTLYNGARAPIYDELRKKIYDYYREKYGAESAQHTATQPGHPKTRYEARIAERLINELLAAEARITVVKGFYPVSAEKDNGLLRSVTFRQMDGEKKWTTSADVFADCSYEADLAAVAGAPYRVGRESREEFNEKHAGVIFMRSAPWPPKNVNSEQLAHARKLNLYRYDRWYETIDGPSTGIADPAVQGFNMRTIITNDAANRVKIEKPQDYDPARYREMKLGNPEHPGISMPNQKYGLNAPKLVGEQDSYVEGDWEARREVTRKHREATLGMLYFHQHDPSVPAPIRKQWQDFGLPKDEFADNGHMPYEIYARETRRIKGGTVFTENDAQLAPKLLRAPVHADSISITEWFLDSHACTPRRVDDSELEGMVMLKNQTFPGQVSYRTILPEEFKNFLVPVCLSSTHVGWGTIRLEPTWMSICEAAAYATAMAKERGVTPAEIDVDTLVKRLAEHRVMISFFNDVEGHEKANWYPAVQYLGTQGYFGSYDARPNQVLREHLADAWIERFSNRVQGKHENPTDVAVRILESARKQRNPLTAHAFAQRLAKEVSAVERGPELFAQLLTQLEIPPEESITRGDACRLIFAAMSLPEIMTLQK